MADNLADKLAELRAQGYTGEYPEQNWFTDINKGVQNLDEKLGVINDVVQAIPIKPEYAGLKYLEMEQVARATVGGGQITVRDVPSMDLSGLNRDPSRALTEESKHDFDHGLKTPFETLGKFARYSEIVAQKSQDVEEYGFGTVIEERIEKGKNEIRKGINKLNAKFALFSSKLKND